MAKKSDSTKVLTKQKQRRRKWNTFLRMIRYGANNFTRNAWLTIAATAVMTITLLIIFATFVSRNVLIDTISSLREQVGMSIYLKTNTSDDDANQILDDVLQLDSVESAVYITPSEARQRFIEDKKDDVRYLEAVGESNDKFPGSIRVVVKDINNTSELSSFIDSNELLKENIDPDSKASFTGEHKDVIENIGRAVTFAERVGIVASLVFVSVSSLIIFNTIRMAIFNRKEEIAMMKLIGADKSFIRGPFVVEAIVYGFIAALIASGLGVGLTMAIRQPLEDYLLMSLPALDFSSYYVLFIVVGLIGIGALIGIVSSLLATRRYLKL